MSALHGIFIRVDVGDEARPDSELAKRRGGVPVDIYATRESSVGIVKENLDVRALRAVPGRLAPRRSAVVNLYDDEAVLQRSA